MEAYVLFRERIARLVTCKPQVSLIAQTLSCEFVPIICAMKYKQNRYNNMYNRLDGDAAHHHQSHNATVIGGRWWR